jgi:hypothetical protein
MLTHLQYVLGTCGVWPRGSPRACGGDGKGSGCTESTVSGEGVEMGIPGGLSSQGYHGPHLHKAEQANITEIFGCRFYG